MDRRELPSAGAEAPERGSAAVRSVRRDRDGRAVGRVEEAASIEGNESDCFESEESGDNLQSHENSQSDENTPSEQGFEWPARARFESTGTRSAAAGFEAGGWSSSAGAVAATSGRRLALDADREARGRPSANDEAALEEARSPP